MRRVPLAVGTGLLLTLQLLPALPAHAAGPTIDSSQKYSFVLSPDRFFKKLCGITTNTTVIEMDTLKTWSDGTQSFHVERTFIPDDPRLPIEKGAGTSYFAADHKTLLRIDGKPIQLIWPDGGATTLDAGILIVGDPNVSHGHVDVGIDNPDLAPFYCPR